MDNSNRIPLDRPLTIDDLRALEQQAGPAEAYAQQRTSQPEPPSPVDVRSIAGVRAAADQSNIESSSITSSTMGALRRLLPMGETFEQVNSAMLGEPVNPQGDIPLLDYWQVTSMGRGKQIEALQNLYGEDNVAISSTGEPLVKMKDSKEWVPLAKKDGGFLYDASRFPSKGAEAVSGATAAILSPGGLLRKSIAGALGTFAGGVAKEAWSEAIGKGRGIIEEPDPFSTIQDRAYNVPVDVLLDRSFAGGFKGLRAISPFSRRQGPVQIDQKGAIEYVNKLLEESGSKNRYIPWWGERTGSPTLLGQEQFYRLQPGSSQVFDAAEAANNEAIRDFQNIILGNSVGTRSGLVPNIEQVGQRIIQELDASVAPFRAAVASANRAGAKTLTGEITGDVAARTGAPRVDAEIGGSILRDSAEIMRETLEAKTGFHQFFSDRRTTAINNPIVGLAKRFSAIRNDMASARIPGQPKEVLEEFVPEGILGRLNRIIDLGNKNGQMALSDLKELRTSIGASMTPGLAMPPGSERYLKRMYAAVTEEMNSIVDSWKDPAISAEWRRVNAAWSEAETAFNQTGIFDLFRKRSQGGQYVTDSDIVTRAFSDKEIYKNYQQFFGQNSPEMNVLRRAFADTIIQDSESAVTAGVIDLGKFVSRMQQAASSSGNAQLFQETFGPHGKDFIRLAAGMKIAKDSGKRADLEDIADLLSDRTRPTVQAIEDMVSKQEKLWDETSNKLLKGDLSGLKPHQIVDQLLHNQSMSNKEVDKIMSIIKQDEELYRQTKLLSIMDIFHKASFASKASDNPSVIRNELLDIDAAALRTQLGMSGKQGTADVAYNKDRIRMIVGDTEYDRLVRTTQLLSGRQIRTEESPIGGTMGRGAQFGLLREGGLKSKGKFGMNAARSFVIAKMYTSPVFGELLANNWFSPEKVAMIQNVAVSTAPFINEMVRDFGRDRAKYIVSSNKTWWDNIYERYLGGKSETEMPSLYQPITKDSWTSGTVEGPETVESLRRAGRIKVTPGGK